MDRVQGRSQAFIGEAAPQETHGDGFPYCPPA